MPFNADEVLDFLVDHLVPKGTARPLAIESLKAMGGAAIVQALQAADNPDRVPHAAYSAVATDPRRHRHKNRYGKQPTETPIKDNGGFGAGKALGHR